MNKLSIERRAQVIRCLVDGNSVRATVRIADVSKPTILKLLADVGAACSEYQHEHPRSLTCKRIQCDEAWSFGYSNAKNVPEKYRGVFDFGDVWLWTAICADCKLIPAWHLGTRDAGAAWTFMRDLASRLTRRVQLTTDRHRAYLDAVDGAFGTSIDYAMLVKQYGNPPATTPICLGTERTVIHGNPDPAHVSPNYVERSNLTITMGNRRYTRLTNAFSKKVENHGHHLALHFMYYNYARQHQTLRISPAMQAGVSDHLWSIEEIAGLLD